MIILPRQARDKDRENSKNAFFVGWSLNGWPTDKLNAYFSGVPAGGLLSLELSCATSASSFLKFTSQLSPPRPVVCGLLDNMGGRRSLSGSLGTIASQTLALNLP